MPKVLREYSRENLQQHTALRVPEFQIVASEATASTTTSVRPLQNSMQPISNTYGNNLSGVSRRITVAPYHTPHEHLAQKRSLCTPLPLSQPSGSCMLQSRGVTPQTFSSAQYPSGSANQFPNQANFSSVQQPSVNNSNSLIQQVMQPVRFPQTNTFINQPRPLFVQHQTDGSLHPPFAHTQQHGHQFPAQNNFQFNQLNHRQQSVTLNGMSGNPTNSVTSSANLMPNLSQNFDLSPIFPELRPPIIPHSSSIIGNPTNSLAAVSGATSSPNLMQPERRPSLPSQNDNELRLSLPVQGGTIMAPFGLQHPPSMSPLVKPLVSNRVFHLKPSVHQTLILRSDLELQLNCFHKGDRQMNTKWPTCVQVSINGIAIYLNIPETLSKPVYLKRVCQSGGNMIQITSTDCICPYLFSLQLVHRPTVSSVVQTLLRKRLLLAANCTEKIKRSALASENNRVIGTDVSVTVSLKCPISSKRIFLPARGKECNHIQCFDLESYIELNCKKETWICPVCNKSALLQGLEVDQFIWNIVTSLMNSDVEEIIIDSLANWKPVHKACDEHDKGIQCPVCSKAMPSNDVECHLVMCLTKPGVNLDEIKCPGCSKIVPPEEDVKCHLVMCLTKSSSIYNEDTLTEDKGECIICLEDLTKGNLIARLSCLCIYHKTCIDSWFKHNHSCPAHPIDKVSTAN